MRKPLLPLLPLIACTGAPVPPEAGAPPPGTVRAVIEIPAGTTAKREHDPATGTFPIARRNGEPRHVAYLPYPANYGHVPGTRMDRAHGGDGDAVDIFVLCAALPVGTMIDVAPIGVIELLDAGERDDKVIALPVDPALRTMHADDITALPAGVRDILVTWLLHYDPADGAELVAVRGAPEARAMLHRWRTE
ncbi:MAG: inorganic diphosphatase [Flavobacteriales bacterium]|jgi:inorganic pyrophosphatase|nr:inorganic diphosphatase [Flavobacteriales bacterium]